MKGPHAQEWIAAVLEEIESFKTLGGYEKIPKGDATAPPLPARLILVTKPNIHGGPARKKARIVICGNFQDVHPDEFTVSKNPQLPCIENGLVCGFTHGMANGMLGCLYGVSICPNHLRSVNWMSGNFVFSNDANTLQARTYFQGGSKSEFYYMINCCQTEIIKSLVGDLGGADCTSLAILSGSYRARKSLKAGNTKNYYIPHPGLGHENTENTGKKTRHFRVIFVLFTFGAQPRMGDFVIFW